ncbi:MAG: metal-sensitive transcriptional regulator, partial [Anaerolineae bacterium]|nr:metal-sensitive transcriptional regulator [Anaerolineae bacterium]
MNSVPERTEIMRRLRRLEGQVRGIQKMLAEGRECKDVITQLLAIRGAVDEVGLLLLRDELNRCLVDAEGANAPAPAQVQQLRDILHLWMR